MLPTGVEFVERCTRQMGVSAKAVFNEHGAIFFAPQLQYRDYKAAQISYEDDYAGNALAAMLGPGRIEIRYHRDFTDERVAKIIGSLVQSPRLRFLSGWAVAHRGRALKPGR